MTELAMYIQELYIPEHVAPYQYGEVEALVAMGCDGGDGQFDEPTDDALKSLLRVPVLEWECLSVGINRLAKCIVLEDVRIVFTDQSVEVEEHLVRYLRNRAERTGIPWQVEKRYSHIPERPQRVTWQRALIVSARGERVRIYYRYWERCWGVA